MAYNFKLDRPACQTFWQLIMRSFIVYRPLFKDKIINAIIWTLLNVIVFAFVMPAAGLHNFGPFILVGTAASNSYFFATNQLPGLITEITGETSNLQYELTLPIPQWLALIKYPLEYAYQGFIVSFMMIPIGLVVLWNQFSFQYFSCAKYHFMLLLVCLFSGFFTFWMASITENIFQGLENLWLRIIFPLWWLGGFQFSWKSFYLISPTLAYINLLNPLTYTMEGVRAAALDPSLSLPYWNCVLALSGFTIIFGCWGIYNLKRRMDCL